MSEYTTLYVVKYRVEKFGALVYSSINFAGQKVLLDLSLIHRVLVEVALIPQGAGAGVMMMIGWGRCDVRRYSDVFNADSDGVFVDVSHVAERDASCGRRHCAAGPF